MRKAKAAGTAPERQHMQGDPRPYERLDRRPSGCSWRPFFVHRRHTPAVKLPVFAPIQFSQEMVAAHAGTPWRTHESHHLVRDLSLF